MVVVVRALRRAAGACVGGVGAHVGGVEGVVARGGVVGVWGSARLCYVGCGTVSLHRKHVGS